MFYIFNVFEWVAIALFLGSFFLIVFKSSHATFGVIIKDGDKVVCDGSNSIEASIGGGKGCDVSLGNKSLRHTLIKYNSFEKAFEVREYNKSRSFVLAENTYTIGNKKLHLSLPEIDIDFLKYGSLLSFFAIVFVMKRMN